MKPNGYVLWRGPSKFNGEAIVLIATGFQRKSKNKKTDDMLQFWILLEDTRPDEAVKTGLDQGICGDCPHMGKTCYVLTFQAPLAIWTAYHNGSYPTLGQDKWHQMMGHRAGRFGAYGDPFATPVRVWRSLAKVLRYRTGYTHQWRRAPYLRDLVMASVDSEEEYHEARAKGWRTFRVRTKWDPIINGETMCPASKEMGYRSTCASCTLCDGAKPGDRRAPITIIAHGGRASNFNT